MKKRIFVCTLAILGTLLCACEDTKPVETTADVTTTTVPVETTTTITTSAPVDTTAAVTTTAPITEEPGLEYAILQNADGKDVGVLFTYPDGSTYRWDCPIETPLPVFVRASTTKHDREAAIIEYYAGDGEWRFDWLDLVDRKLLYRQTDASGYAFVFDYSDHDPDNWYYSHKDINLEKYTFGIENGGITVTINQETGIPELTYHVGNPNNGEGFPQNHCIPIQKVISAENGEEIQNTSPYTYLYSTALQGWSLQNNDTFYGKVEREYLYKGENREQFSEEEWKESELVPRLTGFSTLYYFADGVPDTSNGHYERNAAGYKAWYSGDGVTDSNVYWQCWVQLDEHYAVNIEAYTYDGDASTYYMWSSAVFLENLFYY